MTTARALAALFDHADARGFQDAVIALASSLEAAGASASKRYYQLAGQANWAPGGPGP